MTYRVEVTRRAERDLELLYLEKNAADSLAARNWFNGLEHAVLSLAEYPARCPKAPESARMKRFLRHLMYGKKPHVYRVIFEIDEQRGMVRVLTVRHGARRRMKKPDVD